MLMIPVVGIRWVEVVAAVAKRKRKRKVVED